MTLTNIITKKMGMVIGISNVTVIWGRINVRSFFYFLSFSKRKFSKFFFHISGPAAEFFKTNLIVI